MDNILTTILQNTYSLNQLKTRLRLLKSNLLKTFFGGEAATVPDSQSLSAENITWLKSLAPGFYEIFNKDNVYQTFTDLEAKINSLPTLTMYLTFEPDDITLSQIGAFARKTFGPNFLLDTKIDPTLIAGTALVWKGVRKDYSLKAKIAEKKDVISQEFKKFLR